MNRKHTPILTLLALAVGLASFGCNSSSGGDFGDGGSTGGGGSGGAGGADPAMFRVAHLAPEVPRSGATEVDFTIVDQGSFNSIGFGRVSQYGTLISGVYSLTVTEPGGGPPLAALMPDLEAGVRYTVVAYRDSGEADAMGLMLFEERTDGLGIERGLVLAGHAADDSSWGALHLINAGTDEVLAADLAFGIESDPIDLVAGEYDLGFAVTSAPPTIDRGPFRASVEAAQSLILIVVDADTVDESVDPSVYILTPDTIGMITATPLE